MSQETTHESIKLLTTPSAWWVDISVSVSANSQGHAEIISLHTLPDGTIYRKFFANWDDLNRVNTEYGQGISLIHDLKDHYFYGLGKPQPNTPNTIVQTYYGREVSGGAQGRAEGGDYVERIKGAIRDELFGPRGPRVYDPDARPLLQIYALHATEEEWLEAEVHMNHICFNIMLPQLQQAYAENDLLRQMQASTRDQPWLISHYLPQIRWLDEKDRLMVLRENLGLHLQARAFVNERLGRMTIEIKEAIRKYAKSHDLLSRYGKIFDTRGYSIIKRISK